MTERTDMSNARSTGTRPTRAEPRNAEPRRCRTCGTPLAQAPEPTDDAAGEAASPFCSKRCQLADLNRWFSGEYMISREIKDSDLDTVD
jgi:endogenous inhibitor of DNA gyrase (YacG/DUF329 family)